MAKAVEGDDIVKKGSLNEHIAQLKATNDLYISLDEKVKLLGDDIKKTFSGKTSNSAKGIADLNKAVAASNNLRTQSIKIDKEKAKVEQELIKALALEEKVQQEKLKTQQQEHRLNVQTLKEKERINNQTKRLNKTKQRESSIYSQQSKILNNLRKKYKDVALALGENSKEAKRLLAQITPLDRKLKKLDKNVGQNFRSVGNYRNALKGLNKGLAALGVSVGLNALVSFGKELNRVANEVKGVEFAFSSLGTEGQSAFDRIRKSTRGLLSDLDIKKSIVEFDNFNLSLEDADTLFEFVALRATQTGKSFEGLRDSLVEGLSKESLRRLDNLGISMIDLRKEMDLFGLSVNEAFTKLAKAEIKESGDLLDKAASNQQKLNSEWENFKVLLATAIKPSFDYILKVGSKIVKGLGDFVDGIFGLNQEFRDLSEEIGIYSNAQKTLEITTNKANDSIAKEILELDTLFETLRSTTEGTRARQVVLDEINSKYGTTLQNLSDEVAFVKQLDIAYEDLVQNLENKIRLDAFQDAATELLKQRIDLQKELDELNLLPLSSFERRGIGFVEGQIGNINEQLRTLKSTVEDIDIITTNFDEKSKTSNSDDKKDKVNPLDFLGVELDSGEGDPFAFHADNIKKFNDELERGLKIEKEVQDYNNAILRQQEKDALAAIKREEELHRLRLENIKELRDRSIETAKEVANVLNAQYEDQIKASQDQIKSREDSLNRLNGIETAAAAESRQAEKQAIAKEKVELANLEKRQRELLALIVGLELASQNIGKGDENALNNATNSLSAFLNKIKGKVQGFYGGTEGTVADELGRTGVKDGHIVKVHDNEHIISANDSSKLHQAGFSKTSDIVDSAMAYQTQGLKQRAMRSSHRMVMNDKGIINELRSLKQEVKNIEITKTDIDLVNFTKTIQNSKMYQKTKYGGASIVV